MKTAEEKRRIINKHCPRAYHYEGVMAAMDEFAEQYCEGEMIKLIEWVDNLEYSYCDNAKEVVKGFLDQTNKQ